MQKFWKKMVVVLAVVGFVQNSFANQADPLSEVVKGTPVEAPKAKKVSEKGELRVLKNGTKVRVFKGKITKLPSEKGIVYMTEADFSKAEAELNNIAATPIELKPAKEVDPEPMMAEHPESAVHVAGADQAVEIPAQQVSPPQLTVETNSPETPVVASTLIEVKATVADTPSTTPLALTEEVQVAPVAETPLTVEAAAPVKAEEKVLEPVIVAETPLLLIDKEQVRQMLTEEIDSDKISKDAESRNAEIETEKLIVAEKIKEKQAEQAYNTELNKTKLEIKESMDEETQDRRNSGLAEYDEELTPKAPATDKEMRPVNLSPRGKKESTPIVVLPTLPEQKELTDEELTQLAKLRIERQRENAAKNNRAAQVEKLQGSLEEVDGIEEANGPIFGFSE